MQGPEQLWRHRKFPVFSFFLLFFFSFLEDLVLFLSFAFKGQLVYLVFPKLKLEDTPFLHLMKVSSVRRSTWISVWHERQTAVCCCPTGNPAAGWRWERALHRGRWDGVGWPAGPTGISRATAKGRDVQEFSWTDSLEVGNFTTWKLKISPACHENIKSNMIRLSKTCPVIFWWW